ncbi:MAG: TIM barrel protein [Phycisphaerales bacterium]|nr:TIM barrel protein [Phycisphaerales bacterium]
MKLGLGLYRHALNQQNFRFARQCGCTHIVAHLVDYFKGASPAHADDQPLGGQGGWGYAGDPDKLWTLRELKTLVRAAADEGLKVEAIENFDPAHWHDVLLDGPKRQRQIKNLQTIIRNVGKAGIAIMGYNFSIAGVAGRMSGPFARGCATAVGVEGRTDAPIPNGMVWNMVYDRRAPQGPVEEISHRQLWDRIKRFLDDILPVAEDAGVKLAAHPDDPPFATLRRTPRLVYQPALYQKLLKLHASPNSGLEFCVGSIAEMTEGDVYKAVDTYSRQGNIFYVHLRNVRGKVPSYRETFIDDGDVDILRVLRILKKNNFDGVIIPDHTPQMSCDAPWHAGMAFATGYIAAAIKSLNQIAKA